MSKRAAALVFIAVIVIMAAVLVSHHIQRAEHRQWFRFAEHLSDASVESVGDAPKDLIIADVPVRLFKKASEVSDLQLEEHDDWLGMRGSAIEAVLEIDQGEGIDLREIGGLQLRLRADGVGLLDVEMFMRSADMPYESPWTESVPLHSPGKWVTYRIETSSPSEEVEGTDNRLVRIRLKAPPHAKELDLASIQFLDRRSRLGSTSHGSIREAIGRNAEQCIFAYCPSMISWTVNLGSDPSLEGRWGFLGDGPVKMLLTLSDSDGEHELIRSTLNNESDCESLSAGLERWAGKEVKITWQAEGPRRTVALWGSPIIWSGGRGHQPNVVIYLIDALRADRLGRYGNPHKLTPNADSMAAQGTVFTRAYAAANWTHPSVPSLLMGVMPDVHGASITGYKVRGDIPTLAEIFAAHGYATASYSANGYAGTFTNLDRGFDRARCLLYAYSDELVNDDLGGWIGQHSGVPFFLYVHAMDPHAPYAPEDADLRIFDPSVGGEPCNWEAIYDPEGLEGKVTVEGRRARYDAEVVDADRGLGRLLAWLDELEISDNTIVVFVADHGEYLGEKGEWAHGGPRMGIELLHVPMIWRWPNGRFLTGTVEAPVSLLDVLPTLLAAAGTDGAALDYLQGVNLLPTLKTGDETPLAGRTIWSMASPVLKSAIRGNRQFISNGERFVQDSQSGEWRAVAPSEEDVARQFESWPASQLPPPSAAATGHVEIGHDLVEALRALGYVR